MVRPPVDRDDDARSQQVHRLDRVPRAHVLELGHERADAGDRQHGEVEPLGPHVGDAREEPGVAGEVDAPGARDHVPQTRRASRQRVPRALVLRVRADDLEGPDPEPVAGSDLVDVAEPAPAQREPGTDGREDRRVAAEQPQRSRVVVVEVQVGDQDGVRVGHRLGERLRHAPVERSHQPAEDGVGDQAQAVDLDDRRGMPEKRDAGALRRGGSPGRAAAPSAAVTAAVTSRRSVHDVVKSPSSGTTVAAGRHRQTKRRPGAGGRTSSRGAIPDRSSRIPPTSERVPSGPHRLGTVSTHRARVRNGGVMATIHQQIEVAADPDFVRSTWTHFIQWTHTGPGHLLCDELACVDAVRSGLVNFAPAADGRTTVVFRMEEIADGPAPDGAQAPARPRPRGVQGLRRAQRPGEAGSRPRPRMRRSSTKPHARAILHGTCA